jgi:hypothetical protein
MPAETWLRRCGLDLRAYLWVRDRLRLSVASSESSRPDENIKLEGTLSVVGHVAHVALDIFCFL